MPDNQGSSSANERALAMGKLFAYHDIEPTATRKMAWADATKAIPDPWFFRTAEDFCQQWEVIADRYRWRGRPIPVHFTRRARELAGLTAWGKDWKDLPPGHLPYDGTLRFPPPPHRQHLPSGRTQCTRHQPNFVDVLRKSKNLRAAGDRIPPGWTGRKISYITAAVELGRQDLIQSAFGFRKTEIEDCDELMQSLGSATDISWWPSVRNTALQVVQ